MCIGDEAADDGPSTGARIVWLCVVEFVDDGSLNQEASGLCMEELLALTQLSEELSRTGQGVDFSRHVRSRSLVDAE